LGSSKNGFLLHPKIDESFPKFILYHCVLHLDVLSAKVLPIKHVLETIPQIQELGCWQLTLSKRVWTKPTKESVFIPFYNDKPDSHVPVYKRHVIRDNKRRKETRFKII